MTKNFFGGATINSGPTLPLIAETPDGTLFYKTSAPAGLYFYGFNPDANGGLLGDQSVQGWTLLVDTSGAQPYVLKVGDTMNGDLVFNTSGQGVSFVSNTDTGKIYLRTNSPDSSDFVFELGDNGAVAPDGFVWRANGAGGGGPTQDLMRLNSSGLSFLGNTFWHAGNDGAGTGLDADLLDGQQGSYYLNIANATGILPVGNGGTGSSAGLTTGGVLYGATPALVATSAAGATGQLLSSNGAGAPSWVSASTLSVASAVTANVANSALTTGTAANVPWTGITGLGSPSTALQAVASFPNATTTAYIRPSYHFDMGNNVGTLSMRPTEFPPNSISGWSAYNSLDMGIYQTGLTVVSGGGLYGLQIAANWNTEESAPTGLRYRVNDDTSNTNEWSAFSTLWDSGNFSPSNYVAKAGDTMLGGLFVPSIAVGSVSMPATGGINASGNITTAGGIIAVGGITSNGSITAALAPSGLARAVLQPGSGGLTGAIDFHSVIGREGYIGRAASVASADAGQLNYVAGTHQFTGAMTVTGNIVAQGNVTAFSDRRLKSNIATITDALYKVQRLEGVTFNRKGTEERATGLIAQDVEAVLPEAVLTDTDGMKSVAYGNMVGLLVEAIKEQQEQIALLREQIRLLAT